MSHHANKMALLTRLRELGLRLDTIETALEAPHSRDWDEAAVEREGEEVLERLGIESQAEVQRIVQALKRLADGTYGCCLKCGGDISEQRLAVVPDAPLCRHCAQGAEA